jgi:peptide/nickel transport system permease protein
VIGEIGLDRWMLDQPDRWRALLAAAGQAKHDPPSLAEQESVFLPQLRLAAERNLPASIHCLHAFGRLRELLESHPRPKCGWLLHSYGGPAELVPVFARLSRASANAVWAREFVLAARAAGKGPLRITLDHVLPNIASMLVVQATISFATAILAEAALSYLGLGTQPPQPSWGRMLNEAQALVFQAPMLAVYPGVAIVLSVLGLNLMGDGLRDLLDPKLARQR